MTNPVITPSAKTRHFAHISKPILAHITQECGGVVKTNGLGGQPVITVEYNGAYDPFLLIVNEVVRVGYQLEMNGGKYQLGRTAAQVVNDVERVFNHVNSFYDYNLLRIAANFYGRSWPLKFDVFFYQSGLSETVIIPREFTNAPTNVIIERLEPIRVPIDILNGREAVVSALKSTNLLALLRNISGTVGANIEDCLSLLH